MPEQFHFLQPAWFLALLPAALLLWAVRNPGSADNPWRRVVDERLLPWLLVGGEGRRSALPLWLLGAGWLIAVLALADPVWEKQPQPVYRSQEARVVVLDLSRSMLATDLRPSRLVRARYKVADILRRSEEGQTALVVFAGDAFTVSPLTDDADTIEALLKPLQPDLMPVQGSRADLGLLKAGELLRQAGLDHGDILLVADGFDGRRAVEAAEKLRDEGYRVSVLGVGTADGAPVPDGRGGYLRDGRGNIVVAKLDAAALKQLAAAGGGRYAAIRGDASDLDYLLPAGDAGFDTEVEQSELEADVWQSRGPWLVLLLLPLAALVFRRGWLLTIAFAIVSAGAMAPQPAMASTWDDLWLRRDQQAERLLQRGEAERARELAQQPLRRGTAAYRAGRYEDALQDFSADDSADAHYDRGNALAKLGRYREAIDAYDRALEKQPDMEDAIHNRAQVEKLLRQQEQQQQQNQQSQNGGDQSQQQQQGGEGQEQQQQQQGEGQQQPSQAGEGEQQQQQADTGEAGEQAQEGESASGSPGQQADQEQSQQRPGEQQQGGQETAQEQAAAGQQEQETGEQARTQAGSQPQEQNEEPREGERQQAAEAGAEGERASAADMRARPLDSEEAQAAEQWLRRIPDDPGGLLRRKFLYQYRQRGTQAGTGGQQAW